MSDDSERKAQTWYQTGSGAVARNDFEYASKCFEECCKLVPSKLLYRQALRGAQRKKHKDNGKGVAMASMRMQPARAKMALARRRTKWKDVVDAAEEALALNPWDVPTLYEEGCALAELGHPDCAIWVLETAQDKKTADVYRKLADLYELTEQFDKAIRTWEAVSKLDPADENALSKGRQLAASATIQRGRYAADESENAESPAAKTAAPETYEARVARETRDIEEKLKTEPTATLYRDLGDNYRRLGQLEKATEAYAKGVELNGADIELQIRLKEAQLEPYRRKLSDLEQKRKTLGPAGDAETVKKVAGQINAFKAEICKREADIFRCKIQLNPDDNAAHFELGYRLLQLAQLDDAIKELQKGRGDLQRKWQALCYLGIAFWRKKNFPLAERNLTEALEHVGSNEENRKEVLYYRGRVAQDMGDASKALESFNDIAAIDYEYKDVARRIDEINAAQTQ